MNIENVYVLMRTYTLIDIKCIFLDRILDQNIVTNSFFYLKILDVCILLAFNSPYEAVQIS